MEIFSKHSAVILVAVFLAALVLGCSTTQVVNEEGQTVEAPAEETETTPAETTTEEPETTPAETTTEEPTETTTTPAETTDAPSQIDLQNCIQYCLDLNEDSSQRNIESWFAETPDYCTAGCEDLNIPCTITSFHGETCTVHCDESNIARCA